MDETEDYSEDWNEDGSSVSFDSDNEFMEECDEPDVFKYECLTPDVVVSAMNLEINKIRELVPVDSNTGTLRMLLDRYKWDDTWLTMKFYECNGDTQKLFDDAKVSDANPDMMERIESVTPDCAVKYVCNICKSAGKVITDGLSCNHKVCEMCMELHLMGNISTETSGELQCPVAGCEALVTDEFVVSFTKHQHDMFNHLISLQFVECNRFMKPCPGSNCLNVIKVNDSDQHPVTCICGREFCFQCGGAFHEPLPCAYLKLWMDQHSSDFETIVWMRKYIKNCPDCGSVVQKDGKAFYAVCEECHYGFCWTCLETWTTHWNNSIHPNGRCGMAKRANSQHQNSYMYSRNGWVDHKACLTSDEENLQDDIKLDRKELKNAGFSPFEIVHLGSAEEELYRCHVLLMHCYIALFYMVKDDNKKVFEDKLNELEESTETLTRLFQSIPTVCQRSETISQVSYVYAHCRSQRLQFLKYIQHDTEKNFWTFQLPEFDKLDSSENDDVDMVQTEGCCKAGKST